MSTAITKKEEELRIALALNRGIELLETLQKESSKTTEHHETQRINDLLALFHRTHRDLFSDWKGRSNDIVDEIVDYEKRMPLREKIRTILCANGGGPAKGLFDANGMVVLHTPDELAGILADFYSQVRDIKFFEYGNKLTLDFFMVALCRLPAFSAIYEDITLDFRRLNQDDLAIMHNSASSKTQLKQVFAHALDYANTRYPTPRGESSYRTWPKRSFPIGGVPFLSHVQNGVTYLVTVKGGLVPLAQVESKLKQHFSENGLISDFPPIKAETFLPGTEELRAPGKTDIDGIPVEPGDEGAAPLCCLDVNIMTGLRPTSHNQLLDFLANKSKSKGVTLKITDLNQDPKDHDSKEVFLQKRLGDITNPTLKQVVSVAYDHLNRTVKRLDTLKKEKIDKVLEEKKIAQAQGAIFNRKPRIYISMGGGGSGKSSVKNLVQKECGKVFVEASLDKFREESDLYKLLIAANHHSDDYGVIEPFATNLRDWVATGAKENGLDLLYDGSGIDYRPRYANRAAEFKAAGFGTELIAVDSTLQEAIKRVDKRFTDTGRALQWLVVSGKHTHMPSSFLQAVQDANLDKVTLLSADGKDEHERGLVAETIDDPATLQRMKQVGPDGLFGVMKHLFSSPLSIATRLMKGVWGVQSHDEALAKNPGFTADNVTYFTYPLPGEKTRTLAVYDTARLAGMLEKGLMNPNASSPGNIEHTPRTLPFYMPEPQAGTEGGAWRLRLLNQPPSPAPGPNKG